MKILLIHNNYQSKFIGGEDVVFRNELNALKVKLGEENVFVYCVSNDKINIFKLPFTIWFSVKHYRNIYNLVKKNKIDLVHVHNFYPLLTPSVFKAAKMAGAKTIHTLHNYRWWCISGIFYRRGFGICELCANKKFPFPGIVNKCYRNSFPQSILTSLALFFYKLTNQFQYIDNFFVLSSFGAKKVAELGIDAKKIIIKSNFVETVNIISDEKKDFIYVGKLDESKGVLELLRAWKKLDNNYILKLVGLGELDEELKEFESDNIKFLGKLDNEKTLVEISKSKYLVAPSLWYETFGLTIIEAMLLGVPVIGFNIGTRMELLKDGENGFIAELGGLKETIEKAYNYNDYLKLSKNSREFAERFSKNNIIEEQALIYQKIINGKI